MKALTLYKLTQHVMVAGRRHSSQVTTNCTRWQDGAGEASKVGQ